MNSIRHLGIFLGSCLGLPTLALVFVLSVISITSFDFFLADLLYLLEGNDWALKDYWLTESWLHEGGRKFSVLLALLLLAIIILSYNVELLKPYRRGLCYVFFTAIMSSLLVSILKSVTHMDCPWDLARYGGVKPFVSFFTAYPDSIEYGRCFPAGHASAGYSWFGVYFFVRHYFYQWKNYALLFPLILGGGFGLAQQLRGAHFLSHDIWTAWICWFVAVIFYVIWRPGEDSNL